MRTIFTRSIFAFLCAFSATVSGVCSVDTGVVSAGAGEVILRRGTPVVLVLFQDVQSGEHQQGEPVQLSAYNNVKVSSGEVVINAGRPGIGKIRISRTSGAMGRPGRIQVEAISVQAVDGQYVKLTGETPVKEGKWRRIFAIIAGIIIGTGITLLLVTVEANLIVAAATGIAIFILAGSFVFKGGAAQIKQGTEVHCRVLVDTRIKS